MLILRQIAQLERPVLQQQPPSGQDPSNSLLTVVEIPMILFFDP